MATCKFPNCRERATKAIAFKHPGDIVARDEQQVCARHLAVIEQICKEKSTIVESA